jgi:hypothetical protein
VRGSAVALGAHDAQLFPQLLYLCVPERKRESCPQVETTPANKRVNISAVTNKQREQQGDPQGKRTRSYRVKLSHGKQSANKTTHGGLNQGSLHNNL